MTKSTTKSTERMTQEEVEKVAAYVRRLVDGAAKRVALISPWIEFEVGGFGRWFHGRFEGVSDLPARGIWFSVDPRVVGFNGDTMIRKIESQIGTSGQSATPARAIAIGSALVAVAAAVVDLEATAVELLRIYDMSATHATIVDNVITGWKNRGEA